MKGNKGDASDVVETMPCVLSQFSLRTAFVELRQYEASQSLVEKRGLDVDR